MHTFTDHEIGTLKYGEVYGPALAAVTDLVAGQMELLGDFVPASPWVVLSKDLHNEAHLDFGDKGLCFALFVEQVRGRAKHWAFVLPNLGAGGTIIHLSSGVVIGWDGRVVRHCTAMDVAGAGAGNVAYGYFVGASK